MLFVVFFFFFIGSQYDNIFYKIVKFMFDIDVCKPPNEQVAEKKGQNASTHTQKPVKAITTRYGRNANNYEVYSYKVWSY